VKVGQARLVDVIVGFIDPTRRTSSHSRRTPPNVEGNRAGRKAEEEEEAEERQREEAVDTGPDPGKPRRASPPIAGKIHAQVLGSIAKLVRGSRRCASASDWRRVLELRLSPRMFDALILNLRTHVRRFAISRRRS